MLTHDDANKNFKINIPFLIIRGYVFKILFIPCHEKLNDKVKFKKVMDV
jgi:hypothetical protein